MLWCIASRRPYSSVLPPLETFPSYTTHVTSCSPKGGWDGAKKIRSRKVVPKVGRVRVEGPTKDRNSLVFSPSLYNLIRKDRTREGA